MRGCKIVRRLRGKVSVIRNLGCNYMIARRKRHAGGISLQSPIPNECALFLMEKSHICKIKSQCLFDERICRLCHPFFRYHVLGKKSEEANPLVTGVTAADSLLSPPFQGCFRRNLTGGTCMAVLRNVAFSIQYQRSQSMHGRKTF